MYFWRKRELSNKSTRKKKTHKKRTERFQCKNESLKIGARGVEMMFGRNVEHTVLAVPLRKDEYVKEETFIEEWLGHWWRYSCLNTAAASFRRWISFYAADASSFGEVTAGYSAGIQCAHQLRNHQQSLPCPYDRPTASLTCRNSSVSMIPFWFWSTSCIRIRSSSSEISLSDTCEKVHGTNSCRA